MPNTDGIRYVRYDDTWLRDAVGVIREDLRGHMHDDRDAMRELRDTLNGLDTKFDTVAIGFERKTWAWQTGASVFRWVILVVVGSGGIAELFGKQIWTWIGR